MMKSPNEALNRFVGTPRCKESSMNVCIFRQQRHVCGKSGTRIFYQKSSTTLSSLNADSIRTIGYPRERVLRSAIASIAGGISWNE